MSASTSDAPLRVLCAGDRFITSDSLAAAARQQFGPDTKTIHYQSKWPDEPFGPVDGVQEAAGRPDEVVRLAADVDVILTHLAPITAAVMRASPGLRAVGVTRGGPVNVDLLAATAQGVPVIYLPGRNLGAVAEFVIGVMISMTRNITVASREMASGGWDARFYRYELTGPELRAATVGLVGLGAVGSRISQLLGAFGSRVLAYDPYASPGAAEAVGASLTTLPELLSASDIVSVHARLTDDTRNMFGAEAFASMKPGSRFVNTARGELVDQAALLASLQSGHLAGAALDVFTPEPPEADDPLLSRPDVIGTPHLAGASQQVATESVERVTAEVARYLIDGVLHHCANPEWAGPRSTT
jgi:D-3-phosphoglycerate dehydrogenase